MNNSKNVKRKVRLNEIVSIVSLFVVLYLIYKYVMLDLILLFNKWVVIGIFSFFVISISICFIHHINKLNKFLKNENVFYDLDHNLDKVFKKYGLYITKEYIICIGSKFNFFKTFAVKIEDIDAIDTYNDSRYTYRKKGAKFIIGLIKADIMHRNDGILVFNIICGNKVYCITNCSVLNKIKSKDIEQMADYICNKHKNIDYI